VILKHFSLSRPKIDLALLHRFSRIRDCQAHLLENTLPIGGHSPARRFAPETVKKITLPQKMCKLRSAGRHAASWQHCYCTVSLPAVINSLNLSHQITTAA
jgi:hypothetical protein